MEFNLNHPRIPLNLSEFDLDIGHLEYQMKKITGYDIKNVEKDSNANDKVPKQFVPLFSPEWEGATEFVKFNNNLKKPVSKIYSDRESLLKDVLYFYQMLFFQEVLAKQSGMGGEYYPKNSCGPASRNIVLSGARLGIDNLAYAYSDALTFGHIYTIAPFRLEKENVKGLIILDPTYAQFNGKRNKISIVDNKTYRIENRSENFFPKKVIAMHQIKEDPKVLMDEKNGYETNEFLDLVHKSPKYINFR